MSAGTITQTPSEKPGHHILYVWIAVLFFASANSVVLLLFQLGHEYGQATNGINPISFCNVLFAGNTVACVVLFTLYRKDWTRENLKALTRTDWSLMLLLAVLTGAVGPSAVFFALTYSSVTNVVLVGRVEPFILLTLSFLLFREKTSFWAFAGAVICLAGIVIAFSIESVRSGTGFGRGEICAVIGAFVASCATLISKSRLKKIPLGIFAVIRTGVGAVIFFFAAIYLYGPDHFEDVLNPYLWQWMLVYGGIIVVGGQYFWFTGIRTAKTSDVSLASSFTPVAAIFFAFVLLGERPGISIAIGGAIIMIGIAVSQVANFKTRKSEPKMDFTTKALDAEGKVSFKGI